MPLKKDKFTGFVFMRKSQGKKIYRLELPDDIDKINDIFKNEHIMIKNEIIQFIPLQKMILFNNQTLNEIKKLKEIIILKMIIFIHQNFTKKEK